jgi:hypothetical protein
MEKLLWLWLFLWPQWMYAQMKDTLLHKADILSSGFIDIMNNGQVNSSARFLRLCIGEPGKFALPLCIYSGVSSNYFQNPIYSGRRTNEELANSFINPMTGIFNISFDGSVSAKKKDNNKLTGCNFLYQAGARILTGYRVGASADLSTGKPFSFLNGFICSAVYFQTGAWEKNNKNNMGICWLTLRFILCKSGYKQLQTIIPDIKTNGFYHGWSAAWGIDINRLISCRMVYYKYTKAPELEFSTPIYQFTFNYSVR